MTSARMPPRHVNLDFEQKLETGVRKTNVLDSRDKAVYRLWIDKIHKVLLSLVAEAGVFSIKNKSNTVYLVAAKQLC